MDSFVVVSNVRIKHVLVFMKLGTEHIALLWSTTVVDIRKQSDSLIDLDCYTFELSDKSRITMKFSSPHEHTLKEPRKDFITNRLF